MIRTQLGEPMPDNFDDWDPEDLARRDCAMAVVKGLGWIQD